MEYDVDKSEGPREMVRIERDRRTNQTSVQNVRVSKAHVILKRMTLLGHEVKDLCKLKKVKNSC